MIEECYSRLLPFLGHKWEKVHYDKFGTGRKEGVMMCCRYCGKVSR